MMRWNPMFNGLLNIHDFALFIEKIRQGDLTKVVSNLLRLKGKGMEAYWDERKYADKHWWDVPEVVARWNRMISGDENMPYLRHFCSVYLKGKKDLVALTLGCGTGHREVELARMGLFSRIDGVDFSHAQIEHAREWAAKHGVERSISYIVDDVATMRLPGGVCCACRSRHCGTRA